MKINKLIVRCTLLGIFALTYSCKKIDIPISNQISVSLSSKGASYLTNDITLAPATPISFSWTINSPTSFEFVYIQRNGTEIFKAQVPPSTTYSGDNSFVADAAPGVYTYRFLARDKAGTYLGEKIIVVTITSDFNYFTQKTLFVPDTTAKTNPTYYSTTTNEMFSYSGVGAKSNLIDFGYFYDPTLVSNVANGHTIYALNISPVPSALEMNDLSSFTKNATLLKRITSPTFANITSSTSLQTAGDANLGSGTSTSINKLVAGNLVLFKTAAGKYGIIQVNYVSQDNASKGTFMSIDVKMQK